MITLDLLGQSGNHLFEYSFLRTVGEYNNYDYRVFLNPIELNTPSQRGIWYSNDILSCDIILINRFQQQYFYRDANDICGYNLNNFIVNRIDSIQDNTIISGIFQSKDVVDNINPNWFIVNDGICNYNINNTCFIHVRGTDSLNNPQAYLPDISFFYIDAKNTMEKMLGKKLNYIVITDDIPVAKEFVTANEYISGNRINDFYSFYNAKYSIIPNSTFSWWATFLSKNREICIAPRGWRFYNHNNPINSDWCYTDKFIWV